MIELLVVISIIAVLAGMLMPALTTVRSAARTSQCASNLRQIGMALINYSTDWDGALPPASFQMDSYYWTNPTVLGDELSSSHIIAGAFISSSERRGVLRCPSDFRLAAPSHPQTSISYGMNHRLLPYVALSVATPADWAKITNISRIRMASAMAIATDTLDLRWLTDPTWVSPALPVITYLAPETSVSWIPGQPAAYHVMGRHRNGSNLLFVDGHVAWSNTLPSDVLAKRVYVNPIHVP